MSPALRVLGAASILIASTLPMACSIGEGDGTIQSEKLFMAGCWDGPLDLQPTFFSANAFEDSMLIRVQRGERQLEVSDGLAIVVNDVATIREHHLGEALPIGLPPGVVPPGVPPRYVAEPPKVSLSLYLYETCHVQNGAVYAYDGWMRFDSLFSGDRNETRAQDRLTAATFEALVADPRAMEYDADGNLTPNEGDGRSSTVTGTFQFYFQRGVPAQPFP
jgi:hypothetical protein